MKQTAPVAPQTHFCLLLVLLTLFVVPSISFSAPMTSNFQAHITKPDGQPMQDASVTFTFSYRDPSNSCTLYVEEFPNISMVSSNGDISLKLGAGNRKHPASGPLTYFSMLSNLGSNVMSCFEGGNFTPTLMTQNRKLIVQFTSVNGPQILGGLDIESVPYALYANEAENSKQLGGFAANLYTKFSDVTTCTGGNLLQFSGSAFSCVAPGTPASFSGSLIGDVTGTQGATIVSALRGIPLVATAPTTNQVLQYNGTNWVPTTVAFGGGTVTNVTGTAPISVATGGTTPVISMAAATPSVPGYLTAADFTIFNNKVSSQWIVAIGGIEYTGGNVGIGTSGVPAAKLEISGTSGTTLKIVDGNQAAGKVLMSDAVGQASWVTAPGAFQGSVNVTSTPYTITNLQNGKIFTYAGAGAGTLNLPAISGISDGFQITIVRDVPLAVTIVTNGADTFTNNVSTLEMLGQNIQSITLTKIGTKWRYSNRASDCEIGKACWGANHLYIGTMNGKQYFTTPGGCTNSATPTCAGGPDTTNVSWASNAGGNPAYNITTGINNFYEGKADSATLASTYTDTVAAKYCENMTYAGYSDWYLPARGEYLYLIYEHAGDIPGLTQNSYWVTTEYSAADAWSYYGFGTYMTSGSKATLMRVRCIRNF